jgi:methylenetetrahydrofolate reductase (NADPH)
LNKSGLCVRLDQMNQDTVASSEASESPLDSPSNGYGSVDGPDHETPIVPLSEKIAERMRCGEKWFSLEFFPPRTAAGAANLINRFEVMGKGNPLFCDITWHPAGNPSADLPTSSMTIARTMLEYTGLETVLHMTCCNMTKDTIYGHLDKARKLGVRNLVALRGDPIVGQEWKPIENGFQYATDLVRFVRQQFGNFFTIAVAGYPIKHPEAATMAEDLLHLKEKVDAGADFIITQLFFEASTMIEFQRSCREIGITVPIIPGIMPIQSYGSLRSLVKLSGQEVPEYIRTALEPIKDNDLAVRKYGVDQAVQVIRELFDSGIMDGGIHFYTLNREVATIEILKRTGLWKSHDIPRPVPWKLTSMHHKRASEDVRPIFWALRPKSYVYRTQRWDEFPNGRWSNSQSPAYGSLTDYHLFYLRAPNKAEELLSMWGTELRSEQDVFDVFASFITGDANKQGVKVTQLPWSEGAELHKETDLISEKLGELNRRGLLTINSQPNVNCSPSDDSVHGWGPSGGYVFQKAYLEFFTSAENAWALRDVLQNYPRVNYHMLNHNAQINISNFHRSHAMAVTWGVFPGKEIAQPTVVDPQSFLAWKDEAFDLWNVYWGHLYPEGSKSRQVVESIHDNYVLVNLVDNDFPNDTVLWEILDKMLVYVSTIELDNIASLLRTVTETKKQAMRKTSTWSTLSSVVSGFSEEEHNGLPQPPAYQQTSIF